MAGLGPAIHDCPAGAPPLVDARPKAGHDGSGAQRPGCFLKRHYFSRPFSLKYFAAPG